MTINIQKVEEIISPIVIEEGLKLYDIAWINDCGRNILRVMLESDKGPVNLNDCTRVSRAIEDVIEVKDVVKLRYDLEVSSPGLDRPLRKLEHFTKAVGLKIKLKTHEPIEGRRNYKGELTKVEKDLLTILIDGQNFKVPHHLVSKANVDPW